jgi:hypothetical protein
VDLAELEEEVALLDAVLAPVAQAPLDISDPGWLQKMTAVSEQSSPVEQAGVRDEAEAVLSAMIDRYATGDEATRTAIRQMFDRYTSFRWAVTLPQPADTAEGFRAQLLHLSARDQGADPRDELLTLQGVCTEAKAAGLDIAPILVEVAAMSSDVDKYGMGSTRQFLLRCTAA